MTARSALSRATRAPAPTFCLVRSATVATVASGGAASASASASVSLSASRCVAASRSANRLLHERVLSQSETGCACDDAHRGDGHADQNVNHGDRDGRHLGLGENGDPRDPRHAHGVAARRRGSASRATSSQQHRTTGGVGEDDECASTSIARRPKLARCEISSAHVSRRSTPVRRRLRRLRAACVTARPNRAVEKASKIEGKRPRGWCRRTCGQT